MTIRYIALAIFCSGVAAAQTAPGNYTGYRRVAAGITVFSSASAVRFTFYAPDIVRVDCLASKNSVSDSSYVVIRNVDSRISPSVGETDSSLCISTPAILINCRKFPLQLSYASMAGNMILVQPDAEIIGGREAQKSVRFKLGNPEHLYGTGERGFALDLRGSAFDTYNTQRGGYSIPRPTMNVNVPFIASTRGYAVYFDNVHKGRFDLGASDSTVWSYAVDGGSMTYYLIVNPTVVGQVERFTWLTGRQPLPPRWAFGYLQSKNRYENDSTARAIVHTIRKENFPCDAIILDLAWFRYMGDLEWNRGAWPDPETMTGDFLRQGIKTILITEPYVVEPSSGFREGVAGGYLARDSLGNTFLLDRWWSCGGCNAALVDMTNPAARKWWWNRHPAFLGKYVAGIWTDLGEPERHPAEMQHMTGPARQIHNIYNFLWAQLVFEGMQSLRPGQRVFNLTRSGFAGIQRFGVLPWTGDVARSFDGLAGQIPLMLNMGMSGLAFLHSDLGGYARNPTTAELYVRWMEYSAFCPVMRAHGAGEAVGGAPTEPWQFGTEAADICRDFIRLRYRLLPYTYTLAHENAESGMPLARPLFFSDPGDARAYVEAASYCWGGAFLVAPVLKEGVRGTDVYLPPGKWYDFWSDELVVGGKTLNTAAPLDRIPVFVRSGNIVPMAPVMQWSNERPLDTLTLQVYSDPAKPARFTLYEDDGTSLDYQQGKFGSTTFEDSAWSHGDTSGDVVTIGPSRGEFQGKLSRRTYVAILHGMSRRPHRVTLDQVSLPVRDNPGRLSEGGNGFFYEGSTRRLFVQATCRTDSAYAIAVSYPQK